MYFNIRKPPLCSQVLWNPVNFFFPRPTSNISASNRSPIPSPSSPQQFSSSGHTRSQDSSRPIPSIPPANNPRGEIIFSSCVDKSFREGYDCYHLAFEKKREEVVRQTNDRKRMERWRWVYKLPFWTLPLSSLPCPPSDLTGPDASMSPYSRNSSQSSRGRGTLEVGHHLVLPDPAVQCHRPGKGVGVVCRWPANKGQYARWGLDKEILLADELHPMMVARIWIGVMVAGMCVVTGGWESWMNKVTCECEPLKEVGLKDCPARVLPLSLKLVRISSTHITHI